MSHHGTKAPKTVADLCYLVAVLTALAGFVIGLAVGNGTKAPDSSPFAATPTMVTNWPVGTGIIVAGVFGAFGWVAVAVFFNWLVAMYQATTAGSDAEKGQGGSL